MRREFALGAERPRCRFAEMEIGGRLLQDDKRPPLRLPSAAREDVAPPLERGGRWNHGPSCRQPGL